MKKNITFFGCMLLLGIIASCNQPGKVDNTTPADNKPNEAKPVSNKIRDSLKCCKFTVKIMYQDNTPVTGCTVGFYFQNNKPGQLYTDTTKSGLFNFTEYSSRNVGWWLTANPPAKGPNFSYKTNLIDSLVSDQTITIILMNCK